MALGETVGCVLRLIVHPKNDERTAICVATLLNVFQALPDIITHHLREKTLALKNRPSIFLSIRLSRNVEIQGVQNCTIQTFY